MVLDSLTAVEANRLFRRCAVIPLAITIATSTLAALVGGEFAKLLLGLSVGLISTTALKGFTYLAFFLLSAAFIVRRWKSAAKLMRGAGGWCAGFAFRAAALAGGVCLGLMAGLAIEKTIVQAILISGSLSMIFIGVCTLLWIVSVAPNHIDEPMPKWQNYVFAGAAWLLATVTITAAHCEPWNEIEGLKLPRIGWLCSALYDQAPSPKP